METDADCAAGEGLLQGDWSGRFSSAAEKPASPIAMNGMGRQGHTIHGDWSGRFSSAAEKPASPIAMNGMGRRSPRQSLARLMAGLSLVTMKWLNGGGLGPVNTN